MSVPPPAVTVATVPWRDADAARLRDEQQAELAARYDGVEDIEPVLPPDEMLATVLVRRDGDAVACGSLRAAPALGEAHGELKRMFVRPDARGQGLSRLVLRELERLAAEAGLRRLLLETGVRQPEAIGLYRSAGYRRVENYGPYVTEPSSVCLARWLDPALAVRAVLLTGPVGSGATTVASAVGDLLRDRGVPHAVLDVDALCDVGPPPEGDRSADTVALRQVRAVGRDAADAGCRHIVLARAVERAEDRERYEAALDGADVRVVRVAAPGSVPAAAAHEDAVVVDDGSPAAAAREVLRALAW